ncbi:MAG: hypothetical protein VCD66_19670, partial [Alphaproteobacteria bacterium]
LAFLDIVKISHGAEFLSILIGADCSAARPLEHVLFENARILKKRAIEPTTWIARANPISRKLL